MKGIKLKAARAGRATALVGAAALAVGLSLGGVAHASVGQQPGDLFIIDNGTQLANGGGGSLTDSIEWGTTNACPNGDNFGQLNIEQSDSTAANPDYGGVSQVISASAPISAAAFQNADATPGAMEKAAHWTTGSTAELVVECSPTQAQATIDYEQSLFITFTATGFTVSSSGPAAAATTSISVQATPGTVQVNNQVTLTATVTSGSGNSPVAAGAGTVVFSENGSPINASNPASIGSGGQATISYVPTAAETETITASFTPTAGSTTYQASSTTTAAQEASLVITTGSPNQENQIIQVTVPPTGSFVLHQPSSEPVDVLAVSGSAASGAITAVSISDSRTGLLAQGGTGNFATGYNGYPGWSVVGQATAFTSTNANPNTVSIPAANLNWTPAAPSGTINTNYTQGAATTSGLGTAATLASAGLGAGFSGPDTTADSYSLGATLGLTWNPSTPAGLYQSQLTITANPLANN